MASPPPVADYTPPAAANPAAYAAPAPYGASAGEVGPWGGPLSPVSLYDRSAITSTSRVTVLFRYLLAIPHFIVLSIVQIAEFLAVIAGWFAALFTGRVPDGIYKFVAWVSAYTNRIGGYMYLLTDKWPTFDEDAPYPIAIRFPGPTRLNRAAVLFRYFIAIPAAIVAALVNYGVLLLGFPIWLIVLVKGRVPEKIFDSHARVLHYVMRFRAYYFLLTPAYPSGLLADEPPPAEMPPPGQYNLQPIPPRGGRGLVITYLALGPLVLAAIIALAVALGNRGETVTENNTMIDKYNSVVPLLDVPLNCSSGSGQVACLRNYATDNEARVRDFQKTLDGIDFHGDYAGDVSAIQALTGALVADYGTMATAKDVQTYETAYKQAHDTDLPDFENSVLKLNRELLNAAGAPPLG